MCRVPIGPCIHLLYVHLPLPIYPVSICPCVHLSLCPAERNLNPKAACLKRREQEKGEELSGGAIPPHHVMASLPPHELQQQQQQPGSGRCVLSQTVTLVLSAVLLSPCGAGCPLGPAGSGGWKCFTLGAS